MKVLLYSFRLNGHAQHHDILHVHVNHAAVLLTRAFCVKKAVEDAGGKPEEVTKDEDKLNQDLKDMREALEEKSKELTERTEGAAKYDIFNSRMVVFSIYDLL